MINLRIELNHFADKLLWEICVYDPRDIETTLHTGGYFKLQPKRYGLRWTISQTKPPSRGS